MEPGAAAGAGQGNGRRALIVRVDKPHIFCILGG